MRGYPTIDEYFWKQKISETEMGVFPGLLQYIYHLPHDDTNGYLKNHPIVEFVESESTTEKMSEEIVVNTDDTFEKLFNDIYHKCENILSLLPNYPGVISHKVFNTGFRAGINQHSSSVYGVLAMPFRKQTTIVPVLFDAEFFSRCTNTGVEYKFVISFHYST